MSFKNDNGEHNKLEMDTASASSHFNNLMCNQQPSVTKYNDLAPQHAESLIESDSSYTNAANITNTVLTSTIIPSINSKFQELCRLLKSRSTELLKSTKASLDNLSQPKHFYRGNNSTTTLPPILDDVMLIKKAITSLSPQKQLLLFSEMIDAECTKINSLDEEKDAVRHIDLSISEWLARNVPSDHYTLLQDLLEKDDNVFYKMFTYEAQKALKRLASNNRHGDYESEAQFLLANCYGTGALGVPISTEKAFTLYLLASKQSHLEAIYRAGVCYELGLGTKKSYRHAVNFYRKAASRTHISSMYKLAIIYLRGFCAQPVDIKEAFVWLQRSAYVAKKSIQEHPEVLYVFALSQLPNKEFNKMNAVTDVPYALELLEMTAKMGYLPSQLKLGELYELGSSDNTFPVVEVNDVLSIYWYTQAAQLGSADAALALSCWYLTGSQKVLQQSDRNAYLWARKAAASQQAERWTIAKANYAVGTYIKEGIGVHNEKVEDSFTWFKRSAALGHLNAIHMVENCHK